MSRCDKPAACSGGTVRTERSICGSLCPAGRGATRRSEEFYLATNQIRGEEREHISSGQAVDDAPDQGFAECSAAPELIASQDPGQERVCVRQKRLSANGLSNGLLDRITMTAALVIVLVLWIVASLIFCLALCWAASRPLPDIEASQDTGKLVPMPHAVAENNEESALCAS